MVHGKYKYMANDDCSETPSALIPKIPVSFFAEYWVWVTSGAGGFARGLY